MDCDKLIQNINPCATTSPFRRWDEVGYIVPYADIANIVFNGMTVNFDTIGYAFSVRDRRLNPFAGSGSEFVRGDMGSVSWTERVNFPALANSVENATIANAIANGGRVVVILKQVDYESDGKGKYQVFGIDGGLKLEGEPFDPYADAAWNITLIAEKMSRPAVYLWDTDEATTDAKYSLITQYEIITGLSLADGSVTPQAVYLEVDPEKTCKVILPDGTTLTSTAGVINTTWAGADGDVTLIVPKASSNVSISSNDFIGDLVVFGFYSNLFVKSNTGITSITATNVEAIESESCVGLTSIISLNALTLLVNTNADLDSISAPKATSIDASGCALTSVAIAAQVRATVLNIADLSTVTIDFSGGTNASYATLSAQAQSDIQAIYTAGGTVTYNA